MNYLEESDESRFSGGEGDGQPRKRSKPRAQKQKKNPAKRGKREIEAKRKEESSYSKHTTVPIKHGAVSVH